MTTTTTPRKGARMAQATGYVRANPRCTKLAAAQHAGPNGSLRPGYATVDRAINAGFPGAVYDGRKYELYHIHG